MRSEAELTKLKTETFVIQSLKANGTLERNAKGTYS
jgi:hypothetical protein